MSNGFLLYIKDMLFLILGVSDIFYFISFVSIIFVFYEQDNLSLRCSHNVVRCIFSFGR